MRTVEYKPRGKRASGGFEDSSGSAPFPLGRIGAIWKPSTGTDDVDRRSIRAHKPNNLQTFFRREWVNQRPLWPARDSAKTATCTPNCLYTSFLQIFLLLRNEGRLPDRLSISPFTVAPLDGHVVSMAGLPGPCIPA